MLKLSLSLALASLLAAPSFAQSTATYEVRLDITWSAGTHPGAYPGGAHFSPPIGTLHKSTSRLWQAGSLASNGIEVMAETGAVNPLTLEINSLISAAQADSVLTFSPPSTPGVRTFQFTASEEFPLVSLVAMIAPSPDWFVGVDSLALMENGNWMDFTVDLPAWDSGTDSGSLFTSINQNTNPAEPIHLIQNGPFLASNPLGTMTFTRIGIGSNYCGPATPNSSGLPATILALGSGQADQPLTLTAESLPGFQFGYFLVSTGSGMTSPPASNGILCLGGILGRFNAGHQIRNSGGDGTFSLVLDPAMLPFTPTVAAQSGQSYNFQAWFRESGGTSNFTDAVTVTFQ